MRRLSLFALVGLLLTGCGKDRVEPVRQGPLFSIEVVDSAGLPVEGLDVGRINHPASWAQTAPPVPISVNFLPADSGWATIGVYDYWGQLMAVICDSQKFAPGPLCFTWDASRVRQGFYCTLIRFIPTHGPVRVDSLWTVIETAPDTTGCTMGNTGSDGTWATDDTSWFPCLLGNPPPVAAWGDTLASLFGSCPIKTSSSDKPDTKVAPLIDSLPRKIENAYRDTITIIVRSPAMTEAVTMAAVLTPGANHFRVVWPRRR